MAPGWLGHLSVICEKHNICMYTFDDSNKRHVGFNLRCGPMAALSIH